MLYGDISGRQAPSVTVLEDFEGADPLSAYSGDTHGYTIQTSTVLEGSRSALSQGTWDDIGHDTATTPTGYEYRARFRKGPSTGADDFNFLIQAQNPASARDSCYLLWPSSNDYILVRKMNAGSSVWTRYSATVDIATDVTYETGIQFAADGSLRGVLYDDAGTELVATSWYQDTSPHTGGTFGMYCEGPDIAIDYVTQRPL